MKIVMLQFMAMLFCFICLQGCASGASGKSTVQNDKPVNAAVTTENRKPSGEVKKAMTAEEKEKQALRKFYDETWEAMVAKDMPRLDEQHAEQFVLVHMTGMQQPKKEFLKAIQKGDLNYYKSVPENVVITVSGNKAKIIGQNKVTAAVFGGSTNVWRLQLDFDAVKENGKWRMAHCKASTY
ncbi:MAG: nuclear transport factor 2 family protein [Acidaminococcaceae bacterium]|nr:nuclear transport factor 2 family protein [Acidaminococcaceae bacterium]